ncbi:HAD-IC family P-type ATPase [Patescibacteria group bacterium]|nr:HAD-IC family P-type ATPase [Patescibacteria group bacterium]MBU4458289.1 HAD-IC family P-type ATPase [Patescibacteria group bacterium]MCG2696204.1 HAD-IC family P-type ATPase [Candidatus Portnoybacteria bacterium]
MRQIGSKKDGLANSEVIKRLREFGRNTLPQEKPYSKIRLFLSQFNSPLMYILIATVVISFLLKHYSDSILIIIVLLINTTVGFFQENKANKSLLALKKMVKFRTRVLRDGCEKEIDSEELVVGDVVFLKSGDKVPADGRIIESKGLKINEASLTGESQAVEKEVERANMVFMGTIVDEGRATIVIVAIGIDTQIGEIVSLLKETKERKTPLQKKIASLSQIIGIFILFIISIIIIVGYFTEKSFADIFITSLALTVSVIPEGLLPAITIILVFGMRRIFKQNGLVRKLSATETLGSVTVICTDKTGTLTEGKMQVSHILTNTRELMNDNINGLAKGENANGVESHISALKIATLANDAFVENPGAELQEWVVRGRPTEQALLLAGMQSGLDKKELEKQYPILDRISFESDYKFAATLHRKNENKNMLYVLGAPEEIIARSTNLDVDGRKKKLGTAETDKLIAKLETLTRKGLRVLACAHKDYNAETKYQNLTELVKELSLIGFIALKDPLRQDAKESIAITKKAGIRTVIVTGDHKLTAKAIAEEIGLEAKDENIIEGKDLEIISDTELKEKAKHISIYARVSPRHKLRIVNALQSNGEVVAMLGDGVNDAPALKSADIGVAVGSGTDVAKEVADLVLLDDNFKTVVKAIEQGRVIFGNIRKVFVYLVADDFSELFLFLTTMAMGFPLPLLPAQILWINLVEDGFPGIALTAEQETKGVMDEKPRNPKEPILNKPLKLWMTAIFFISGLVALLLFFFFWKTTGDLDKTRTIVFTLICFDSLFFAFSVRSFKRTIFRKDIFSNRYLVGGVAISLILLIGAIYFSPLQKLLATQPLGIIEWLIIFGITLVEIVLIEFFKKRIFCAKPINTSFDKMF